MTTDPMKPPTVAVRAADVKPYEWALWCRIEGGEPFANEIVSVKPSEDGVHLWFMLDSHNFWKVKPDDVLDLIPTKRNGKTCDAENPGAGGA